MRKCLDPTPLTLIHLGRHYKTERNRRGGVGMHRLAAITLTGLLLAGCSDQPDTVLPLSWDHPSEACDAYDPSRNRTRPGETVPPR